MKVLIIGFGVEGKILTDYFMDKAEVTVADQKSREEFEPKVLDEYAKRGVKWQLGSNYLDGMEQFDLIAHSPGIKPEVWQKIENSGVRSTTQTQIFLDECKSSNIIGVTGTNGKGTTSTMIYEMLKAAGHKTWLAGNIGEGMLPHLEDIQKDDWVVLELSSYQLKDVRTSPHIGVILNITPDHMNMHRDFEEYSSAKANLIRFQTENDYAILNGDYDVTKEFASQTAAKVVYFSREDIRNKYTVKIPGEHNFENAAAVVAVAKVLKINNEIIKEILNNFEGLEHRLQTIAVKNGVRFVDDSISTNPATVLAAIKSFSEPKVLILGGSSKMAEFDEMAEEIAENKSVKAIILTGQTADEIQKSLKNAGYDRKIVVSEEMNEIIDQAKVWSEAGDVVLLSPACASFGKYVDYKDRGEKFKQAVEELN